jgi:hypothetical protein
MALTNCYATLDDLRQELAINVTTQDPKLEAAINAASRMIDGYTGRFFYQDAALSDRTYHPEDYLSLEVDDISTTTGLVVKLDDDDDGTFETTLAITTNFILTPTNAAVQWPVQPYTGIRIVDSVSTLPIWVSGRPSVQITAKFGWPAVPDNVNKACLVQAAQLFKSSDAVFGMVSFLDGGGARVRGALNPQAEALLERFCKARVG